jgi:hypothetical protein
MLEALLQEIKKGSTTSPVVLAEKLKTTPAMVAAMLDTLERQGFLQSVDPGCNPEKPCESCALSGMCSTNSKDSVRIRVLK